MQRVWTGMARKKALLATVAVMLGPGMGSGCSFVFIKGPPADHESRPYFECTSEPIVAIMPVADAVAGALVGFGAMVATQVPSGENQGDAMAAWAIASGLLASAVYGLASASRCQDAKTARQRRWLTTEAGGMWSSPPSGAEQAGGTPDPWLTRGAPPQDTRPQAPAASPETGAPVDVGKADGGQ